MDEKILKTYVWLRNNKNNFQLHMHSYLGAWTTLIETYIVLTNKDDLNSIELNDLEPITRKPGSIHPA